MAATAPSTKPKTFTLLSEARPVAVGCGVEVVVVGELVEVEEAAREVLPVVALVVVVKAVQ